MEISRIGRKPIEVDVVALLPSGQPAPLTAARFALCGHGGPDADTTWVEGVFTPAAGQVPAFFTVVIAGPDATDKAGALVCTEPRMELWAWPTQAGIVAAGYIDTVEVR